MLTVDSNGAFCPSLLLPWKLFGRFIVLELVYFQNGKGAKIATGEEAP